MIEAKADLEIALKISPTDLILREELRHIESLMRRDPHSVNSNLDVLHINHSVESSIEGNIGHGGIQIMSGEGGLKYPMQNAATLIDGE